MKEVAKLQIKERTELYANILSHIEKCIKDNWNSEEPVDKKVRLYYDGLKKSKFTSSKYSLMMVDMCADQFLYDGKEIIACVDLDAYVIGHAEWELSFLKTQIEDWDSFRVGYEMYQSMPAYEETAKLYYFIMALNAHWDKQEMERILG